MKNTPPDYEASTRAALLFSRVRLQAFFIKNYFEDFPSVWPLLQQCCALSAAPAAITIQVSNGFCAEAEVMHDPSAANTSAHV